MWMLFFFNDTRTTEISTLSLHDALPIYLGLPLALGLAFLGGLILNLMPCVFPVLAMKAATLAGHAHEPRAARLNSLAFLRSEEHTSELQSRQYLVCRLLLEKKK